MLEKRYYNGLMDVTRFMRKELLEFFRMAGYMLSEASFCKKVEELVKNGQIIRVGRNVYSLPDNKRLVYEHKYSELAEEEYIRELQKNSKRVPVLLERTVYAFGLLEALARVGMPFIFKGGTCLMLLMDKLRRLSTDIDISVKPGIDLDGYLDKVSEIFPFQMVEEQKRVGKNNIIKRHFKFTYDSSII